MQNKRITDGFGRHISYLRLSLTDRCDLRCLYCMSERPQFLSKNELLSTEEIVFLATQLVERGIKKIRLTGGEPLVRKDFLEIAQQISMLDLDEWVITSNGTLMPIYASKLYQMGLRRVNISLDSLQEDVFAKITRGGELKKTLTGIEAALENGIAVKINCVALAGLNENEIPAIIEWAHKKNMDFTLIETMPMSDTGFDLTKHYLPLTQLRQKLEKKWQLVPEIKTAAHTGPAQFYNISETGGRLGLITPISNNFCANCNRVRVSVDGKLWSCLGQNHFVDLRKAIRANDGGASLNQAFNEAMIAKPLSHNFFIDSKNVTGSPQRMMATTGG